MKTKMNDVNELKKRDDETIDEYMFRICSLKETLGVTWDDIARIINKTTGQNYTESRYRKTYKERLKTEALSTPEDNADAPSLDEDDFLRRVAIEKVKLSDERTQNNAYLRRMAREESIKEIAETTAKIMANSPSLLKFNNPVKKIAKSENEAILLISDWHYGIEVNTYWNTYNPDVARERISKLVADVIDYGKKHQVHKLHIFNLGDLICGRIHLQLRIESRENAIEQIISIQRILSEMILKLSEYFVIEYYDCDDNHSRIEPNKKESIQAETLVKICHAYLSDLFKALNRDDITIHENKFGDDIISADIAGHSVIGVHGHKDKPNKVVSNLTLLTHEHYDLVLTAHLHHFIGNEQNESLHISNGSLMGADVYATDLRLVSSPSQTLILCVPGEPISDIHRIIV